LLRHTFVKLCPLDLLQRVLTLAETLGIGADALAHISVLEALRRLGLPHVVRALAPAHSQRFYRPVALINLFLLDAEEMVWVLADFLSN